MSLKINIQRFAEGGDAGNAAENSQGGDLAARFEALTGQKWEPAAPAKNEKAEAPEPAAETGGEDGAGSSPDPKEAGESPADPDAEFDALIKGKFREQYGKRVQSAVNDRFKNQRKAEKENEELWDAIDPYLLKSGVKRGDVAALRAAAEQDRSNFNKIALQKGTSAEEEQKAYASLRETEKENREKEAAEQERQRQEAEAARQKIYEQWAKDEEAIRKTDPAFSIEVALKTKPEFFEMVNSGVSVKNAYRATYYEENMANVAGAVYRQGKADTTAAISARQNRPREGALGSSAAGSMPQTGLNALQGDEFDAFLRKKGLL